MRVVMPSLAYGDFAAVTLPAWRALLPDAAITLVTTPDDVESQAVAAALGIDCVVTDAWRADGAVMNKAAALDVAFGLRGDVRPRPDVHELCLSVDADVYPFGALPAASDIAPTTLYGCARYQCDTPEQLYDHIHGRTTRRDLRLLPPRVRGESSPSEMASMSPTIAGQRALGFFQLFRYRPGVAFGSYPTAGKYDLEFRRHFAHRVGLWSVYCLHLGELNRANWKGRVVPRWGEVSA
jgi:hypothetical protein